MTALFPIWGQNTSLLAREMIEAGLQARIICVDQRQLLGFFLLEENLIPCF